MPRSPSSDLSRLRGALEIGIPAPFRAQTRSIVDVGCGRCDECDLLLDLFPAATLTLIDIDRASIHHLERRLGAPSARVRSVLGDAQRLAEIAPGPYDLAIIRHPDLDARREVWDTVIRVTVDQLASTAILIFATYTPSEAEVAQKIVQALPVQGFIRPSLVERPVALAGNDRYILMCSRP